MPEIRERNGSKMKMLPTTTNLEEPNFASRYGCD